MFAGWLRQSYPLRSYFNHRRPTDTAFATGSVNFNGVLLGDTGFEFKMTKPESFQRNAKLRDQGGLISRWATTKQLAGIMVISGLLLGSAGTVIAMMRSFRRAATDHQPVHVETLASGIESSLELGLWLSPLILGFAILWIVARRRLRTLKRANSWPNQNAV